MRGRVVVDYVNQINLSLFELFSVHLKHITKDPFAKWYAFKEAKMKDRYEFLWSDIADRPTKKGLKFLKEEGYSIAENNLISLKEAEEKAMVNYVDNELDYRTAGLNGIACPVCGNELYDNNPSLLLMTNPPRVRIECRNCWFKDTRIV